MAVSIRFAARGRARIPTAVVAMFVLLVLAAGALASDLPPVAGSAAWRNAQPAERSTGRIEPIAPITGSLSQPLLSLSDYPSNCTVFVDYPLYALYDWMEGDEIYFAYQDLRFPKVSCDTTYPFVVTHIGMTLVLYGTSPINVQVFLLDVDPLFSSPICPIPGDLIYLANEYPVNIPGPGVYSVVIVLESPVPVYAPYFACIYFGSDMSDHYPGIAIDSVPYLCINYNEWGYGLYDLADNPWYNFPGSIHLFSIGYSKAEMLPRPRFVFPTDSGIVLPGTVLWVAETNNKYQYESAKFDYFKAGQWYHIASDFDGSVPKRDGVYPAISADGWSVVWHPYGLNEGNYLLRVSIADFDSTYVSDTISVYLDINELTPRFVNRTDLMSVCGAETLTVTVADENPVAVTFGYRYLPGFEERSMPYLKRNDYGDANGNPNDGNHEYNGEFGEYYSAPCIFASMLRHWFDKGYLEVLEENSQFMTNAEAVEKLATLFNTRANKGTEDDDLAAALLDYLKAKGNRIKPDIKRRPDWEWFKSAWLGKQATVALAIRQPFGHWLSVQKVNYGLATADSFPVTYYDPVGGLLRQSFLLTRGDSLVLGYLPNNTKYPVNLGVALYPRQDALTYTTIGTDFDPLNGFQTILPTYFQENLLYLIRARALDNDNHTADNFWVMKYDCVRPAVAGDANGDGIVTIADAVYLMTYIFGGGPPPQTLTHGDADCDGAITVSDAVYLVSFIFGSGPAPCS